MIIGDPGESLVSQIQDAILGTTLEGLTDFIEQRTKAASQKAPALEQQGARQDAGELPDGSSSPKQTRRQLESFRLITILGMALLAQSLLLGQLRGAAELVRTSCLFQQNLRQATAACSTKLAHHTAGVAFLTALAYYSIVFGLRAALKISKRSVRNLHPRYQPAIAVVHEISKEMGLRLPPIVGRTRTGARIADFKGRPVLAMSEQTAAMALLDGAELRHFKAIVRHEIAHILARDFAGHRRAKALRSGNRSIAFVIAVLAFIWLPASTAIRMSIKTAVVFIVVELSIRALLRRREYLADLRASQWDPDAMAVVIERAHRHSGRRVLSLLRAPLALHPLPSNRLLALSAPQWLERLSATRLVVVGTMSGVVLLSITSTLREAFAGANAVLVDTRLAGFIAGLPIGLVMAEAALSSSSEEDCLALQWKRTMVLTFGLVIGVVLSPLSGTHLIGTFNLDATSLLVIPVLFLGLMLAAQVLSAAIKSSLVEGESTLPPVIMRHLDRRLVECVSALVFGSVLSIAWSWADLTANYPDYVPRYELPDASIQRVLGSIAQLVGCFAFSPYSLIALMLVYTPFLYWRARAAPELRQASRWRSFSTADLVKVLKGGGILVMLVLLIAAADGHLSTSVAYGGRHWGIALLYIMAAAGIIAVLTHYIQPATPWRGPYSIQTVFYIGLIALLPAKLLGGSTFSLAAAIRATVIATTFSAAMGVLLATGFGLLTRSLMEMLQVNQRRRSAVSDALR